MPSKSASTKKAVSASTKTQRATPKKRKNVAPPPPREMPRQQPVVNKRNYTAALQKQRELASGPALVVPGIESVHAPHNNQETHDSDSDEMSEPHTIDGSSSEGEDDGVVESKHGMEDPPNVAREHISDETRQEVDEQSSLDMSDSESDGSNTEDDVVLLRQLREKQQLVLQKKKAKEEQAAKVREYHHQLRKQKRADFLREMITEAAETAVQSYRHQEKKRVKRAPAPPPPTPIARPTKRGRTESKKRRRRYEASSSSSRESSPPSSHSFGGVGQKNSRDAYHDYLLTPAF